MRGSRRSRGSSGLLGLIGLWRLRGLWGLRKLSGLRGLGRMRGLLYIYIVRWLGHYSNRLYGFMELLSKMSEWVSGLDGYPLDCYDY